MTQPQAYQRSTNEESSGFPDVGSNWHYGPNPSEPRAYLLVLSWSFRSSHGGYIEVSPYLHVDADEGLFTIVARELGFSAGMMRTDRFWELVEQGILRKIG